MQTAGAARTKAGRKMAREFDVIIYGATGYTGRLVAEYFARTYPEAGGPRWAVAGRSEIKLQGLLQGLSASPAGFILADSEDPQSLQKMAERTSVVINTAGPYQLYGGPVVAACVAAGTACRSGG